MPDMTSIPNVSVIMPMYNALPFVKEAVASILRQTTPDFELLIIDNGSTDGSLDYARSLSDGRVRVLSEPKRGAGKATTTGIMASRGEFLAVMDCDDIAHPDRLRTEVEFLRKHPAVVLVGTRFAFLVESTIVPVPPQPREDRDIKRALLQGRPVICNPSTMFRATAARAVDGHHLAGPGHDVDFFLRLSEIGEVHNIPTLLHYYRLHGASTSIVRMAEVNRYHAFSIACARARSAGREEPDKATFWEQWEHRSIIAKLGELADCKALGLYRSSIENRAQRRYLKSLAAAAGAAFLSPLRTSWHVKRKLRLC